MYTVTKRIEIAGSHCLDLNYSSPCQRMHGHNWIVQVSVQGSTLNSNGMLIDFKHISNVVNGLDHQNLNDIIDINPTAENIAFYIMQGVQQNIDNAWRNNLENRPLVTKVSVQESEGNVAVWTRD